MVTSRVKMQHGVELKTSFIDHFGQTTTFDLNSLEHNNKTVDNFLITLKHPKEEKISQDFMVMKIIHIVGILLKRRK